MAKKQRQSAKAPAKKHEHVIEKREGELFSYAYDLNRQLVEDAASALAGDRNRNPPMIASIVILIVLVVLAASPFGDDALPLLAVLVVVEAVLWTLSARWRQLMLRKLRAAGLDCALVSEDANRFAVHVFEDELAVVPEAGGSEVRHALSALRKIKPANNQLLLVFADGYVPIPHKALSVSRFDELERFLHKKLGK